MKRTDTQVYSSINYVGLQLGGGKMLPANQWSNNAGNSESSSALLTFLLLLRASEKNKRGMKPGWLDVPCYVAVHCWCANPQEAVHTLSLTDVSITAVGRGQMARGGRARQLWHFSEARSHRRRVAVMKWEKEREKEREIFVGQAVVKWKWKQFMSWLWALRFFIKIGWRPHTESLLPFPITSYYFGFMLCLSCHNP